MRFDQFIVSTNGLPSGVKVAFDATVFKQMVEFILTLDPSQLSSSQVLSITDIIANFNMIPEDEKIEVENTGNTLIKSNRDKVLQYANTKWK